MKYWVLDVYEYDPVNLSGPFETEQEQDEHVHRQFEDEDLDINKFSQLIGLVVEDDGTLWINSDYIESLYE